MKNFLNNDRKVEFYLETNDEKVIQNPFSNFKIEGEQRQIMFWILPHCPLIMTKQLTFGHGNSKTLPEGGFPALPPPVFLQIEVNFRTAAFLRSSLSLLASATARLQCCCSFFFSTFRPVS
jgi:hypothetical protein